MAFISCNAQRRELCVMWLFAPGQVAHLLLPCFKAAVLVVCTGSMRCWPVLFDAGARCANGTYVPQAAEMHWELVYLLMERSYLLNNRQRVRGGLAECDDTRNCGVVGVQTDVFFTR